jgi:hypothetical protein
VVGVGAVGKGDQRTGIENVTRIRHARNLRAWKGCRGRS